MQPHLEDQPFRFFDLPPELRLRVYDYMTWRSIIDEADDDDAGVRVVAVDLPLAPVFLANKQLAGEYKRQWKRACGGGISLIVLEKGFSGRRWPFVVPERLRSRVVTCYIIYPLDCKDYGDFVSAGSLGTVDWDMLRKACKNRHKLDEQAQNVLEHANEKRGAERSPDNHHRSQDGEMAQLAGLSHYEGVVADDGEASDWNLPGSQLGNNDGDGDIDEDRCKAIDTIEDLSVDLHMELVDIITEFRIMKDLHLVLPLWWKCAPQSLSWPKTPHGRKLKKGLKRLVAYKSTRSCVVLRATSK